MVISVVSKTKVTQNSASSCMGWRKKTTTKVTSTKTQQVHRNFPVLANLQRSKFKKCLASRCTTSCHQSGSGTLTAPKHRKWKAHSCSTELDLAKTNLKTTSPFVSLPHQIKIGGDVTQRKEGKKRGSLTSLKTAFLHVSTSAQAKIKIKKIPKTRQFWWIAQSTTKAV